MPHLRVLVASFSLWGHTADWPWLIPSIRVQSSCPTAQKETGMSVEHGVPSAAGFVAVVGPPAVGKSTVTGALADRFGARVFRLRQARGSTSIARRPGAMAGQVRHCGPAHRPTGRGDDLANRAERLLRRAQLVTADLVTGPLSTRRGARSVRRQSAWPGRSSWQKPPNSRPTWRSVMLR